MEALPYKVIKSAKQYDEYCDVLEELVVVKKLTKNQQDVVELLTLLVEKWDQAHNTFAESDPVESLIYLMKDHKLKAVDLAADLGVGKSLVSDILNYRRALSREVIRKLSLRFKVNQELFNRPYKLASSANSSLRDASVERDASGKQEAGARQDAIVKRDTVVGRNTGVKQEAGVRQDAIVKRDTGVKKTRKKVSKAI